MYCTIANELKMKIFLVRSVDGERGSLPGKITELDLVKVWDNQRHHESVYVLPAWYVIVDRSSQRLHAIDPPVYRRLAAAAAKTLAWRWKQNVRLLKSAGGFSRSNRDVESTTTGVQLSQLLTPPQSVLSNE